MKKLSLLTGFLILLLTTSCREIANTVLDALPPFNVPFNTTVQVPFVGVSTTTYTRTPEIPMNLNLDQNIKANNPNFSINNLKSVKLSTLTMEYVSSDLGSKLDVIKNAKIYIKSPNQAERLIATALDNTNPNTITFIITDDEILEYFRTNQNSLIFEIQASRAAADLISIKVNSGFKIKVQL